ncbi:MULTISPECIES: DUF6666 family protein [Pirellulaceae]|nr:MULTISPECIES: DUF6666 family protein [Pirellulaceae]
MRVFPWILTLLTASCGSTLADLATAAEPREPAKLQHVVSENYNRPPSPTTAIRSLFSTDQDRVFAARQRVARASYVASKVQAGDIQQVDYSVLNEASGTMPMEGEIIMEGPAVAGIHDPATYHGGPGCSSCQGGAACGDSCGSCDTCGVCGPCETICFPLCFRLNLDNLSFRAGVQGFKGPLNAGMDGSFGFLYGVNWGAPLFSRDHGFGVQLGVNGTNANLHGASFTDDNRDQFFLTAGFFRRVDWGWQGGLVYDHMSDHWYYDIDASQIRGELSWKFQCKGEFGLWFTASDETSDINEQILLPGASVPTTVNGSFQPHNMFAFFYRTPLEVCGGEMRFSGGWTDNELGLVGADVNVPITKCLALETNFLYLIPRHDNEDNGDPCTCETWNIGINLVWYPRACSSASAGKNYYRPLFNVANNGTFSMYPTE